MSSLLGERNTILARRLIFGVWTLVRRRKCKTVKKFDKCVSVSSCVDAAACTLISIITLSENVPWKMRREK
jgi:hypothetical protein